jgi:hypothetical protein
MVSCHQRKILVSHFVKLKAVTRSLTLLCLLHFQNPAFSPSHIKSLSPIFWDKALKVRAVFPRPSVIILNYTHHILFLASGYLAQHRRFVNQHLCANRPLLSHRERNH